MYVATLTGWDKAPSGLVSGAEVLYEGNNDAWRLIDAKSCRWVDYHIGPGYFRQPARWNLKKPDVVFNLISDIDQNPKTLDIAERITRPVRDRVVNDPARIRHTGRDDIAKALRDIPDLIVPSVIRVRKPTYQRLQRLCDEAGFVFPAIVRRAGTHSGRVLGVFREPDALRPVIDAGEKELLLTEFRDFRSPDGLFRKVRFFLIGDGIVFRHLLFSEDWNVHAKDRLGLMAERPDLRREEERLMDSGGAELLDSAGEPLRRIKEKIRLDYFGVDCALAPDGKLLVFEANATMNFFPFLDDRRFDYVRNCQRPATDAMMALLQDRSARRTVANG